MVVKNLPVPQTAVPDKYQFNFLTPTEKGESPYIMALKHECKDCNCKEGEACKESCCSEGTMTMAVVVIPGFPIHRYHAIYKA